MNGLILTSLGLPFLGFLLIFLSEKNEQKIANISFWFTHAMGISIITLLLIWGFIIGTRKTAFRNHRSKEIWWQKLDITL